MQTTMQVVENRAIGRLTRSTGVVLVALLCCLTVSGQQRVSDTVHNLSIRGPGIVTSPSESEVCIFCHAPHNTSGSSPLWNRQMPTSSFAIYSSSTLDAQPGQPTGSSKLCLSCHDGTIALGDVLSRDTAIQIAGQGPMPPGPTNLGTDLSDDHPVSFVYSSALSNSDSKILPPTALPPGINLDGNSELQCTSCHDPHQNMNGNFLVKTSRFGNLCSSCHNRPSWPTSSHATSVKSVLGGSGNWPYSTVAENACQNCHQTHGAPGHQRLLRSVAEEGLCLDCHSGQVATYNIQNEINKAVSHDPAAYLAIHDAAETASVGTPHVECSDCHNPHAMETPTMTTSFIALGATLARVKGITASGSAIAEVNNEYEVCFRCHGDSAVQINGLIPRQAPSANLRLDFSTGNASFHPVVTGLSGASVPSLKPGIPHGSQVRCTDCHNNDQSRRFNGSGPDGPHGSAYDFLLQSNYTTTSPNSESAFEYALCYRCHDRQSILNDDSFKEHQEHISEDVACSACHDPHGVSGTTGTGSDHTHLINFDLRYVFPRNGVLKFEDQGFRKGSCTLICHGEDHDDEDY